MMTTVSTQTGKQPEDIEASPKKSIPANVTSTTNTTAATMATAATSAMKKTVTHQQLYGSRKSTRTPIPHQQQQQQQQKQQQQAYANRELQYSTINRIDDITSTCPSHRNHCMYQHSQHSQSTSGLPHHMRLSDSYATLPSTVMCGSGSHGTGGNAYSSRWLLNQPEGCYCVLDAQRRLNAMQCTCGTSSSYHEQQQQQQQQKHQQQQQQQQQQMHFKHLPRSLAPNNTKLPGNGCYFGYENASHITDEEDSAFPGLPERELNLLHRNVPALRRTGVDTTGMRQYFYPDGGWGWIICGLSFLAHLLTTGLQLSYGLLTIYILQHLHQPSVSTEWLGAMSWSVSVLVAPFVVALCRKKSTRLLAVIGGLLLPLSILFTSFAMELEQIAFSYGFIFGIGVSMVRDSSAMMLGNYFKRRRNFVEMVAMSGEGVGIALFSVILKEGVGKAGWRLGLQIIAAFLSISFFMALFYRPASLYHPQRRAIQHLKNQRKKMREDKTKTSGPQNRSRRFLLDMSPLKSANVKILVMTSGVAAFGIYAPMFTISLSAEREDTGVQDLVLLQAFLGISTTLGVVLAGLLVRHPFRIKRFNVTSQVVSQIFISAIAIAILFLSFVMGYQGLCILSWVYGIGFGGYRYSMKILALERVKLKQFSKAWGLIRGIESVPVLVSVPLTTFLNDYSLKYGRAGYYICSAAAAIAGIIIFFINHTNLQGTGSSGQPLVNRRYENGLISTLVPPPPPPSKLSGRYYPMYNYNNDIEYNIHPPNLLSRSCISLNNAEQLHGHYQPVCCRLQLQCFRNLPGSGETTAQPFSRHNLRRRTIESDMRRPLYTASQQYISGKGSVGSRMGKRLQNELSLLQNPYRCDSHLPHTYPNHWGHQQNQSFPTPRPVCTCSTSFHHLQNCRSLSVPEGLSTMSQCPVCSCRTPLPTRRELLYYCAKHSSANRNDGQWCEHHHHQQGHHHYDPVRQIPQTPSTILRSCHIQRSESLTKPLHYVEQMTTSV